MLHGSFSSQSSRGLIVGFDLYPITIYNIMFNNYIKNFATFETTYHGWYIIKISYNFIKFDVISNHDLISKLLKKKYIKFVESIALLYNLSLES